MKKKNVETKSAFTAKDFHSFHILLNCKLLIC